MEKKKKKMELNYLGLSFVTETEEFDSNEALFEFSNGGCVCVREKVDAFVGNVVRT